MEETNRQRKIAGVLQKDLVDVLQKAAQDGMQGVIISVSKVAPFTLSNNILRTDTAVITAISLVNFINNLP